MEGGDAVEEGAQGEELGVALESADVDAAPVLLQELQALDLEMVVRRERRVDLLHLGSPLALAVELPALELESRKRGRLEVAHAVRLLLLESAAEVDQLHLVQPLGHLLPPVPLLLRSQLLL